VSGDSITVRITGGGPVSGGGITSSSHHWFHTSISDSVRHRHCCSFLTIWSVWYVRGLFGEAPRKEGRKSDLVLAASSPPFLTWIIVTLSWDVTRAMVTAWISLQ